MNKMENWRVWLGAAAVLVAALLPRTANLDQYVTTDEVLWLYRSGNFYRALELGEWEETWQTPHPGVMTMWPGMAGYMVTFRGYRAVAPDYFEEPKPHETWLREAGYEPLAILAAGRFFVALQASVLLALCFCLLQKLVGFAPALGAVMMLAWEPYYIGLTQILHVDGPFTSYLMAAVLALLVYVTAEPLRRWLWLAGALAGLAYIGRSLGVGFVGFAGLVLAIGHVRRSGWKQLHLPAWQALQVVSAMIVAIAIAWPAMWVDPVYSLTRPVELSLRGAAMVTNREGWLNDDGEEDLERRLVDIDRLLERFSPERYLEALVWRSSPLSLVGLAIAIFGGVRGWPDTKDERWRWTVWGLVGFAVGFMLGLGFIQQRAVRYALPAYWSLQLVGALGWAAAIRVWVNEHREDRKQNRVWGIAGALLAGQLVVAAFGYPYFVSYFNPLLGGPRQAKHHQFVGWGEGLDMAGRYLAELPAAEELTVTSWYGTGPMSYFFPGQVYSFGSAIPVWGDAYKGYMEDSDYIVVYISQETRNSPSYLLETLAGIEPNEVFVWREVTYAKLYRVSDLPTEIYEALLRGPGQ